MSTLTALMMLATAMVAEQAASSDTEVVSETFVEVYGRFSQMCGERRSIEQLSEYAASSGWQPFVPEQGSYLEQIGNFTERTMLAQIPGAVLTSSFYRQANDPSKGVFIFTNYDVSRVRRLNPADYPDTECRLAFPDWAQTPSISGLVQQTRSPTRHIDSVQHLLVADWRPGLFADHSRTGLAYVGASLDPAIRAQFPLPLQGLSLTTFYFRRLNNR